MKLSLLLTSVPVVLSQTRATTTVSDAPTPTSVGSPAPINLYALTAPQNCTSQCNRLSSLPPIRIESGSNYEFQSKETGFVCAYADYIADCLVCAAGGVWGLDKFPGLCSADSLGVYDAAVSPHLKFTLISQEEAATRTASLTTRTWSITPTASPTWFPHYALTSPSNCTAQCSILSSLPAIELQSWTQTELSSKQTGLVCDYADYIKDCLVCAAGGDWILKNFPADCGVNWCSARDRFLIYGMDVSPYLNFTAVSKEEVGARTATLTTRTWATTSTPCVSGAPGGGATPRAGATPTLSAENGAAGAGLSRLFQLIAAVVGMAWLI